MIRRQTRSRLIAALFMSTALIACSSPEQRMERYTAEGNEFFEEGDFLRANIQYRNALKIDETHTPALKGLVSIAEQNREYETMFSLLQRLARLEPENTDAIVKLGNIYLIASDEAEAQQKADEALAIDPNFAPARALKASVLYKLGDTATAVNLAKDIIRRDPGNQDAVTLIAADRARQNDIEGALAEVEKGLAQSESHILLQLMRIELLGKLGRQDDVDKAFRDLIAVNPEDPSFRQTYAQSLINLGRLADARDVLAEVVSIAPDVLDNHRNLIRVDYQLSGPEKALATFTAAANARPDDEELQFAFAEFLISQDRSGQAETIYQQYAGLRDDAALRNRGKVELAGLYIRGERNDEASALLAEVLEEDEGNTGAKTKLAALKLKNDDVDSAIIDLRSVINGDPDNLQARLLMGAAHEQQGNLELAEVQFTRALERGESAPSVANPYATFLIRNNNPGRAEQILEQSLAVFNDNIPGLRLLASARLTLQDWTGAEEAGRLIEHRSGIKDPSVNRILGTASLGQQNYAEAISRLEAANSEQPLSSQPLATLVSAYLAEGRADDADALLARIIDGNPRKEETYDAQILRSRVAFTQNRRDDAERILNEAVTIAPERIEAYDLLYRYYLRTDRRPDAFALIYQGLEQFKENYGLKVFEADILMNERRFDDAIAVYETLHRRRPDDRYVANNYASLLSEHHDDPQSRQRALDVAKTVADVENPYFQDTLGWAYFKVGNLQDARLILKRAAEDYPNIAVLHYHLGAVYSALENKDDARTALERAQELGGANFRYSDEVQALLENG